ncbi:MAG: hypothetical protein N2645_18525 [Clostridia bacterium]|nr:hypothetical protein [Clostridia bacterium]
MNKRNKIILSMFTVMILAAAIYVMFILPESSSITLLEYQSSDIQKKVRFNTRKYSAFDFKGWMNNNEIIGLKENEIKTGYHLNLKTLSLYAFNIYNERETFIKTGSEIKKFFSLSPDKKRIFCEVKNESKIQKGILCLTDGQFLPFDTELGDSTLIEKWITEDTLFFYVQNTGNWYILNTKGDVLNKGSIDDFDRSLTLRQEVAGVNLKKVGNSFEGEIFMTEYTRWNGLNSEPIWRGNPYNFQIERSILKSLDIKNKKEKWIFEKDFFYKYYVRDRVCEAIFEDGCRSEMGELDMNGNIKRKWLSTNNRILEYSISPDKKKILYIVRNFNKDTSEWGPSVQEKGGMSTILVMDLEKGWFSEVASAFGIENILWSPCGKKAAFSFEDNEKASITDTVNTPSYSKSACVIEFLQLD